MNIEEFEKLQPPRAKRSRLDPFKAQIFELKAKGYTNIQVCEWLAFNDVKISMEGVRKFIQSREKKEEQTSKQPIFNPINEPTIILAKENTSKTTELQRITNPTELRKARERPIDLNDYLE